MIQRIVEFFLISNNSYLALDRRCADRAVALGFYVENDDEVRRVWVEPPSPATLQREMTHTSLPAVP